MRYPIVHNKLIKSTKNLVILVRHVWIILSLVGIILVFLGLIRFIVKLLSLVGITLVLLSLMGFIGILASLLEISSEFEIFDWKCWKQHFCFLMDIFWEITDSIVSDTIIKKIWLNLFGIVGILISLVVEQMNNVTEKDCERILTGNLCGHREIVSRIFLATFAVTKCAYGRYAERTRRRQLLREKVYWGNGVLGQRR